MISFENLSLAFEDKEVFRNINFKLDAGKTLVVVGPSGQGKTCFLKLIASLILPSEGRVLVNAKDINSLDKTSQLKMLKSMGMLFQKNALFDSMTVAENIRFAMTEAGDFSPEQIEKSIDYYLEEVGILHAKDLYPDEISGGMQKRLGIARALALEPRIILYDDPTAGLDPITSKKIIELIISLKNKNNATVVAVTNDMNRAFQMADHMAMLVNSEMIWMESVAEAKKHTDPRVTQFLSGDTKGPLSHLSDQSP
jgi:phospholipid/cholesterol/gamma-HCH transport system ATP-binding protein